MKDLLLYLNDNQFDAFLHWFYKYDISGNYIKKIMQQLFIINYTQKKLMKHFISDCIMQVNATFNINKLKMCFIIVIDVTNISKMFFIAQLYAVFESKKTFNYFFFLLNQKVFNDCPPLWVIITDQGRGIIASLPTSMPLTTHQFCTWYTTENIKKVIMKLWNYESDTQKAFHELT